MSNSWIVRESAPLTTAQMQNNAVIVRDFLHFRGWSDNAIYALLGNMQGESTINPGRWENDTVGTGGFGLVGWTPASKVRNWILSDLQSTNYTNGNFQLLRILWEVTHGDQWIPTTGYNISFSAFTTSTQSIDYLTSAFLRNYERPTSISQTEATRRTYARNWFMYLSGIPVTNPIPAWLILLLERSGKREYTNDVRRK